MSRHEKKVMQKSVSVAQIEQVRKMAGDKGIDRDRFQKFGLDNGLVALALDAVVLGLPITIGIPIIPPPGGRIHTVRIKVALNRPWLEAVNTAGPDTPDNYNVRKVGDLYLPTGTGVIEEDLILLNYPAGDGSWEKALAWADQFRLRKTDPRRVFAIGEGHPNFHKEVGIDPTYVVATEECSFVGRRQACVVWWSGSERRARLDWVSRCGYAHAWFAFRK